MQKMNFLKKVFLISLERCSKWIKSDELFIQIEYYLRMGKQLRLNPPITFNEKLQWLKLHGNKEEYTQLVDKYEVKKFVANLIGEEYIIPTLGVWECFEDIDFNQLPNQFVLKCTHDSGTFVICKDKTTLDINAAREKINKRLSYNYYYAHREKPYKNVKPRIIAEQYMVDESGTELKDYKFFCFNGDVKMLFIATDRGKENEEVKFDFFDTNFTHLPFVQGHPNSTKLLHKPIDFEKMIKIASELSLNIPHVRIDLYNINGKVYFGEYTFFHFAGIVPFNPEEWDYTIGKWIKCI